MINRSKILYELDPYQQSQTNIWVHLFVEFPYVSELQLQNSIKVLQNNIPILKSNLTQTQVIQSDLYQKFVEITRKKSAEESMNYLFHYENIDQDSSFQAFFSQGLTTFTHFLINHSISDLQSLLIIIQDFVSILKGKEIQQKSLVTIPQLMPLRLTNDTVYKDLKQNVKQFTLQSGQNNSPYKIITFSNIQSLQITNFCKSHQISPQILFSLTSILSKQTILQQSDNNTIGIMVAANLTKQQQIGSLAESLILQSNNLDVQNNFVVTAQILTTQLRELTGNFYNQLSQIMRNRKYNNQLMALESYYSDYTSNMGTLSLDSALDIKFGAQMVNKVSVPITQLHCGTFKGKLFGVFSTNELTIQCTKLAECWKSHVLEVTK